MKKEFFYFIWKPITIIQNFGEDFMIRLANVEDAHLIHQIMVLAFEE